MRYVLFILLGYLSGSVLWAWYLPLWLKKIDVTEDTPDGNPGVFNCVEKAGWPVGLLALALELLKGALPVLWAARDLDVSGWPFALVLAAPAAGHIFPIFRGFRGGKGIAVSFGALLGLLPVWQPVGILAVCYLFFSLVVKVDPHRPRSIVTFLCFGAWTAAWGWGTPVSLGGILLAALVILRHLPLEPEEEATQVRLLFSGRKK